MFLGRLARLRSRIGAARSHLGAAYGSRTPRHLLIYAAAMVPILALGMLFAHTPPAQEALLVYDCADSDARASCRIEPISPKAREEVNWLCQAAIGPDAVPVEISDNSSYSARRRQRVRRRNVTCIYRDQRYILRYDEHSSRLIAINRLSMTRRDSHPASERITRDVAICDAERFPPLGGLPLRDVVKVRATEEEDYNGTVWTVDYEGKRGRRIRIELDDATGSLDSYLDSSTP